METTIKKQRLRDFCQNLWWDGEYAVTRFFDYFEDRRLGISTGGTIRIETLLINWQGNHHYMPTSYKGCRDYLAAMALMPDDVFVDFGCGKGRVLALASQYPVRRIVGVEIAQRLADEARLNVERFKGPRRCNQVEVWCGSAADFPIPPDSSCLFFYNPFRGEVLARVFANIAASLDEFPRPLRILYANPLRYLEVADQYPWVEEIGRCNSDEDAILYRANRSNAGQATAVAATSPSVRCTIAR
jgi:SAM-dependent methyltransferase